MLLASRFLVLASLMVSIAGCTTSDDPSKGGFLSGLKNTSDGTYDRRLQERQKNLEDVQDQNLQKQRELQRVQAQQQAVGAQRSQSEAKLAGLQQNLRGMKAKLAGAKTEKGRLAQQLQDLENQAALAQNDSFSGDAEKTARVEALRREKDALEKEIDAAIRR